MVWMRPSSGSSPQADLPGLTPPFNPLTACQQFDRSYQRIVLPREIALVGKDLSEGDFSNMFWHRECIYPESSKIRSRT